MSGLDQAALETSLRQGLAQQGLDAGGLPLPAFLEYLSLLAHWNRAYNLTAVRDPLAMVSYHLLDSLAVLPYLHGLRCLDIGSGAGLPGLVLALARPDQHWTLLDSNTKKTRFLQQVRLELGIPNIDIVRTRIEAYASEQPFSSVTARAVAGLEQLWSWAQPLLAADGRLLAPKGAADGAEISALESQPVSCYVHVLHVPGVDVQRSLITVQRAG